MKVCELRGAALDWAVTKCEGFDHSIDAGFKEWGMNGWATNWELGGPIIEREGIELFRNNEKSYWFTSRARNQIGTGPTPLVAAMRCYVASKMGDEIDVPDELCTEEQAS
jgi:hypothetical protein